MTVAPAEVPSAAGEAERSHRAPKRRRRVKVLAAALVAVVSLGLAALWLPLPFLESYLAGAVIDRVAGQVACPGATTKRPTVTVGGGRLLPQVLRGRLAELRLSVPDVTIGGARHARFDATLRDVSQPSAGSTRVGSMDASITVGFADIPTTPGEPPTTYKRASDGLLAVQTVSRPEDARNATAKLFLRMELRGESVAAVPQQLRMFGVTLKAERVAELSGGVRIQRLPDLPDGVRYRSITPRPDGLHVALDGVATEPLSRLPTEVDGRQVSYRAKDGLLGISTTFGVPPIINVPLTIFTAPRLTGGTLTLVPQSVEVLGANRAPDDPLAQLVLGQIKQESLTRRLPALPAGVRYRSASVDATGIKVAVGGVTVKPFSELSTGDGRPTTFGAENGLLTATTRGGRPDGSPTPIVLYAKPAIVGNTLDIAPQQIEMFGVRFPAANVLAQVRGRDTTHPLQQLPANLAYRGVEVLPDGLRITMSGTNVLLRKGQLTGGGC